MGTTRFELLAELGKGGMGVVYDAYDRDRDMRVALKKLRNVDAASIYRFKREFRALRDLSHPNIIALYELVAEGDDWYLTMERIDGQDIISYVHELRTMEAAETASAVAPMSFLEVQLETSETETGTSASADTIEAPSLRDVTAGLPSTPKTRPDVGLIVDIERLRDCLRQLAHALYALHSAGMVHRDLKPSNVFVTREGRVVLMDFGIVSELSRRQAPVDGTRMIGTPSFMAPEQIRGGTPTAAADWYAFGVLLYVALTAHLPFVGSVAEKLRAKKELDPWPPSAFVDEIPADLERLCMQLLAREPDSRPRDRQILSKLGVASERHAFSSDSSFHGSDIFVGRAQELQSLHEAYQIVASGGTQCAVVQSTSGMGKSSLLERFVDDLRDFGAGGAQRPLVLTARCQETENLSYKAFDGVMDDLCAYLVGLPDEERANLTVHNTHALSRIFPVLRNVPGWKSPRRLDHLSPAELRSQAADALRALLGEVARTRPVVMRIDDIHWADSDSLELLLGILQPPPPGHLMLVAAMRSDVFEDGTDHPLNEILAALEARRIYLRIELGPLFEHEQRALIKALAIQRGVFDDLNAQLGLESGGHPMLLAELVWYAMEAPKELAEAAGLSLEGVMARRVARLPENARALLEIIAVAGEPLPLFVLADACGMSDVERERSLSILRINHLTHTARKHEQERWLDVYHDKVRETILTYIPPVRARKLHRDLARVLKQWPAAPKSSLARHSLAAGDTRTAAGYLVAAAQEAVQALAVDRAAGLFRAAGELMDDLSYHGDQDFELDVMRCRAWIGAVQTARGPDVKERSLPLLKRAHTIASRYQLDEELAAIHLLRGHLLFASSDVDDALREYGDSYLHAQRSGLPTDEAHACSGLGHAHFMRGDLVRARRYYNNSIEICERHELVGVAIATLPTRGMTHFYQWRLEAAMADCRTALDAALSLKLRRGILMARAALGFLLLENGQFDEARFQLYEAVDIAHRLHMRGMELALWSLIGKHLNLEGQADEGIALIERSLAESSLAARRFAEPLAMGALAILREDSDARAQALARGRDAMRASPVAHTRLFFCRDAIDALYAAGDADGVSRFTSLLGQHRALRTLPWGQFMLARGNILASHLRGPHDPDHMAELQRLYDQAAAAGMVMAMRQLGRALAL